MENRAYLQYTKLENMKARQLAIVVTVSWNDNREIERVMSKMTVAEAKKEKARLQAKYPNNIVGIKYPC